MEAIERRLPAAVELRHRLHANPELAYAERQTAAAVAAALPVAARAATGTGLVAVVGGGRSAAAPQAPLVAVRAELDALPVRERTGASFSARGETMHACGHDVHMAALVALTGAVDELGEAAPGRLAAVFQPSEEAHPSGAEQMARVELAELAPDAVVAAHVHPQLAWGSLALDAGAVNASCDTFEIVVDGEQTHGAYPHHGRDPVLALAQVVVALHAQAGRRVDPLHAASLTVATLTAGSAENVIPERASARGAVRALLAEDRLTLRRVLEEVVGGVAAAHGCVGSVEIVAGEPPLANDEAIARRVHELLAGAGLASAPEWRSVGSDDFAFFGALAPLAMAFVGLDGAPGFRSRPLHHPELLPPDEAVGAVARAQAVLFVAAAEVCGGRPQHGG